MKTSVSLGFAVGCLFESALGLSAAVPSASIIDGLRTTPLIRASDASPVLLTEQWRSGTPFGIFDETAVVAFLRHYA